MSLAAVAARRLLLRRGVGALSALFVTVPRSQMQRTSWIPDGDDGPWFGPPETGVMNAAPPVEDESTRREEAAKPFRKHRRDWSRANERRDHAWNTPDADLLMLGSTSRAWRMTVMVDRLRERESIEDRLNQRIERIWKEPLGRLQALVSGWLNEGGV